MGRNKDYNPPDEFGLKYIQITDIQLIPEYLVTQVKGAPWTPEDLYQNWNIYMHSPFNLLYALADEHYATRGFVWLTIHPMGKYVMVNAVSIDRKYQGKGWPNKSLRQFIERILNKISFSKVVWATTRPGAFRKIAQKSPLTVMEVHHGRLDNPTAIHG